MSKTTTKGQGHGDAPDGRLVRTLLDRRQAVNNEQNVALATERDTALRKWEVSEPATLGMVTSESPSNGDHNSADPRRTNRQPPATSCL